VKYSGRGDVHVAATGFDLFDLLRSSSNRLVLDPQSQPLACAHPYATAVPAVKLQIGRTVVISLREMKHHLRQRRSTPKSQCRSRSKRHCPSGGYQNSTLLHSGIHDPSELSVVEPARWHIRLSHTAEPPRAQRPITSDIGCRAHEPAATIRVANSTLGSMGRNSGLQTIVRNFLTRSSPAKALTRG
jgi:hypothetical protein